MSDEDDEILSGALVHLVDWQQREQHSKESVADRAEGMRIAVDEARLALAELAVPSVTIIALRLAGAPNDWNEKPLNKDREDTAWEVLSRIGIPRLRATAIAASIASASTAPAPGSPGWEPQDEDDDDESKQLGVSEVDAQIESFLAGVKTGREL